MLSFLYGNWALFVGGIAFVVTLALWRLVRDAEFKRDVGGAVVYFGAYVVLRLSAEALESAVPKEWHIYVRVAWLLAFAYGVARLIVASALLVRRLFSKVPTPKIHRDVADFVLYFVATVPILKTQLKLDVSTLLGTSAVLSLVLGFALQDTLSNLFSGISLQLEPPFQVGDFIKVGQHEGRVVHIAWRSCRVETMRHELITLPNAMVAKEAVLNFTRGGRPVGIDLRVVAGYGNPPNEVKAAILQALDDCPLVLKTPPATARTINFDDSGVQYLIRVFIQDYGALPSVYDEVLSRLWYRFGREGIEIPYPQRVVTMRQESAAPDRVRLVDNFELFAPFSAEERTALARAARERRFGAGEAVVTQGESGDTFYVVVRGRLSVRAGTPARHVATVVAGEGFGEMSLLTGEVRAATVVALEDCVLLELDRAAFAQHFAQHPERAPAMAELLASRKANLSRALAEAEAKPKDAGRILERLRAVFRT